MSEYIRDKLSTLFMSTFGMGISHNVNPEEYNLDDFGFDSIDIVDLSIAIEEEFDIVLSDYEMFHVKTVQDIISIIERELKFRKGE